MLFIVVWLALMGHAVDQEYPADSGPVVECLSVGPSMACEGDHSVTHARSVPTPSDTPDVPDDDPAPPDDDEDHDKGHGNNPDRHDRDNPGKKKDHH